MANGGRSIVDYIVGSPVVWQVVTHLEVIIDDTHYCVMGGDFDHRSLRLQLSIDNRFVEPQHMVVTIFFLPRFKYDKSKAEEYQLALTMNLGNLWVAELIGHLRETSYLTYCNSALVFQQCLLLAISLREGAVERDIAINPSLTLIVVQ